MAQFGDLASELVGRLSGLSPFLAETFIQRSYRRVREERLWTFLATDGVLVCPAAVSTGTAAVTQFSATVTMSAAATTALNAIPTPALTALQIRFMGIASTVGQTSQIYNILTAVGSPLVLTLDRVVQEPTNALTSYLVYRVYVQPPIADFLKWDSLDDMINGFTISKGKLSYSSSYFDVRDPQRQALALAYLLGLYKGSSQVSSVDSTPIYELWPGSTQGQQFYVRFRRRGVDPAMTDPVPSTLPDGLIVENALAEHAYPHCQANIGHFPAMFKVNWGLLVREAQAAYKSRLMRAKITDNEVAEQQVLNRGHGLRGMRGDFPYPIDSNFFQSHAIFW